MKTLCFSGFLKERFVFFKGGGDYVGGLLPTYPKSLGNAKKRGHRGAEQEMYLVHSCTRYSTNQCFALKKERITCKNGSIIEQ